MYDGLAAEVEKGLHVPTKEEFDELLNEALEEALPAGSPHRGQRHG